MIRVYKISSKLFFRGAITTQFCFTYTLEGVTAMPRPLHARLCRAFLVLLNADA